MSTALIDKHCRRKTSRLGSSDIEALPEQIHVDWSVSEDGQAIQCSCRFENDDQSMVQPDSARWLRRTPGPD